MIEIFSSILLEIFTVLATQEVSLLTLDSLRFVPHSPRPTTYPPWDEFLDSLVPHMVQIFLWSLGFLQLVPFYTVLWDLSARLPRLAHRRKPRWREWARRPLVVMQHVVLVRFGGRPCKVRWKMWGWALWNRKRASQPVMFGEHCCYILQCLAHSYLCNTSNVLVSILLREP